VYEVQAIPSSFTSRWLTMTDLFAKVMALAEEGGLSSSTAGELYSVSKTTARTWLQKYQRVGQVGRRRGTGLWHVSSPAQDAALVRRAGKY